MEADNDDFLITAPTEDHIDRLARPLEDAWQITKQAVDADSDSVQRAANHQRC
jgi:hypothetical protein